MDRVQGYNLRDVSHELVRPISTGSSHNELCLSPPHEWPAVWVSHHSEKVSRVWILLSELVVIRRLGAIQDQRLSSCFQCPRLLGFPFWKQGRWTRVLVTNLSTGQHHLVKLLKQGPAPGRSDWQAKEESTHMVSAEGPLMVTSIGSSSSALWKMEKVNQQNPLLPTCMADGLLILQIRCPHLLPYIWVPCDVRRPKENYTETWVQQMIRKG